MTDPASPEAIQARIDARARKRIAALESELRGRIAIIATINADLSTARAEIARLQTVLSDANADMKALAHERDEALADLHRAERNFASLVLALQAARDPDNEFHQIAEALHVRSSQ